METIQVGSGADKGPQKSHNLQHVSLEYFCSNRSSVSSCLSSLYVHWLLSEQTQPALLELDRRVEEMQQKQQRQENQELADWLSPIDFLITHNDICARIQDGTGQWLLESQEFQEWRGGNEVVWCPGI